MIRFLFLTVASPFYVGIYENDRLISSFCEEGKASDALPILIDKALSMRKPQELYYTNGPGNHMSLKIAYVSLKSVSIAKNIPLFGLSPFIFNENSPIRAFAKSYFALNFGKIELINFDEEPSLKTPTLLEEIAFDNLKESDEPLFLLPPV